jgi:hypothetical protein
MVPATSYPGVGERDRDGKAPCANAVVCRVEPRSGDAKKDLTGPGCGAVNLLDSENAGGSVLVETYCLHGVFFLSIVCLCFDVEAHEENVSLL